MFDAQKRHAKFEAELVKDSRFFRSTMKAIVFIWAVSTIVGLAMTGSVIYLAYHLLSQYMK